MGPGDKHWDKRWDAPVVCFKVAQDRRRPALIEALAETGRFDITVGAYPDPHPEAAHDGADIDWLKRKVDAGAGSAITQFFFEADTFFRFRDRCAAAGIDAPIIPGILPIENWKGTRRFAERCGAHVPGWIAEAFDKADLYDGEDKATRHDLLAVAREAASHEGSAHLQRSGAEVDGAEHDRLTAALQVAGHAAIIAFGHALSSLGYDADRLRSLWTPPHRVMLALLARMGTLDAEVYLNSTAELKNMVNVGYDLIARSNIVFEPATGRVEVHPPNTFLEDMNKYGPQTPSTKKVIVENPKITLQQCL